MNTDGLTKSETLEDLIERGREQLARRQEQQEQFMQEELLAIQKAQETKLALVLEQLPESVHSYVEMGGSIPNGAVLVKIQLPNCDLIGSYWRFENGRATQKGDFEVRTFVAEHWDGFPGSHGEHVFATIIEALAFAVEQGPTYEIAEAAIAERAKRDEVKTAGPTLQEELRSALEYGADTRMKTNADYLLLAVIAQALVSIAESQKALANNVTY